eukprot:scaffold299575_cov36-Tisochrysis_lutea.AAC.4
MSPVDASRSQIAMSADAMAARGAACRRPGQDFSKGWISEATSIRANAMVAIAPAERERRREERRDWRAIVASTASEVSGRTGAAPGGATPPLSRTMSGWSAWSRSGGVE